MDPQSWRTIRTVFEAALDVPRPDRPAFVRAECGDDAELIAEVESMLAADTASESTTMSGILDRTPAAVVEPVQISAAPLVEGDRVGQYTIRRRIGSGGMGTVYEAEQDHPARAVAIKVMNRGLHSDTALRRFRFEAEVLAKLEHPAIARIYEAGTFTQPPTRDDPGGTAAPDVPFFAMEFIEDGRDLASHVRDAGLRRDAILELCATVAEAIHHGHLQGVVHRDLKPANILVDRHGRPKVIDFGIARSVDAESDPRASRGLTREGQVIGTLDYASPEQLAGGTTHIDGRSDVYSLGVVAFRLLTGELPHRLEDTTLPEAARIVVEEDAPRLGHADRSLRGDLETVVGKALEKDPSRRYPSADEFARDLRNVLHDRPVTARPASAIYQLRKLARRHRAATSALAVLLLALLVGTVIVAVQNVQIRDAQERTAKANDQLRTERALLQTANENLRAEKAKTEAANAELRIEQARTSRASGFLRGILAQADAYTHGAEFTMREALDAATANLGAEFGDDPVLEAEIRQVVGDAYRSLTVLDGASDHLERALELRRTLDGPTASTTLAIQESLALLRDAQDRAEEAVALQEPVLAAHRANLGEDDPETLSAAHNLAVVTKASGDWDRAETLYQDTLRRRRAVLGDAAPLTLLTWHNLAKLWLDSGRLDQAEDAFSEILRQRTVVLGPNDPDTLITLDLLGLTYRGLGSLDESVEAHRMAHAGLREHLGDEHDHTMASGMHLSWALMTRGDWVEAGAVIDRVLETALGVLGPDHAHTFQLQRMAAAAARRNGDADRAIALLRDAHAASSRRHGVAARGTIQAAYDMAYFHYEREEFDAALQILDAAFEARTAAAEGAIEPGPLDGSGWMIQGLCLAGAGRFDEAETKLKQSLELHRTARGPNSEETFASLNSLIRLYEASGDAEKLAATQAERDAVAAARGQPSRRGN